MAPQKMTNQEASKPLGKREKINGDLLLLTEELLAGWDTYETVLNLPEKNYIAKQSTYNQTPMTIIKWHCDGLTEEMWAKWRKDPTSISIETNPKLKRIVLPDDEGYRVRLLKMQMPMFISNRSTMTAQYENELEDGTQILI